jgi:hypothetical protein
MRAADTPPRCRIRYPQSLQTSGDRATLFSNGDLCMTAPSNVHKALLVCMLFFLVGCGHGGPSVPNIPFAGPYPEAFAVFENGNPLLAREIGKLPEIQDGMSAGEGAAMVAMALCYQQDSVPFGSAFEQMYRVGRPQVRPYCTPLQALYWLFLDGRADTARQVLETYTLKRILDAAWGHLNTLMDDERWRDFHTVLARLNAPGLLDYYERKVLLYKYIPGYGEGVEEVARVFRNRYGHCAQITAFTVYFLRKAGYSASRHIVHHPALTSPKGSDHRACVFTVNGRKYIMDNGRRHPYGIMRLEDYDPLSHPYLHAYETVWKEMAAPAGGG